MKHRSQSNCFDGEEGHTIPSQLLKLLLDLPQVKKNTHEECFFPTGVTLRKTSVQLHSQSLLDERITAVRGKKNTLVFHGFSQVL